MMIRHFLSPIHAPLYKFFSVCIQFPLCLRENQSCENLIHLANKVDWSSLGFHEIFICVDLIYGFRSEFVEKTWHLINLIYGSWIMIYGSWINNNKETQSQKNLKLTWITLTNYLLLDFLYQINSRKQNFEISCKPCLSWL